jgi:hypothetical protein
MRMRRCGTVLAIMVLALGLAGSIAPKALADTYIFTQIDVPGAVRTQARGINDAGHITGWFQGGDGLLHGYLLSVGHFTTIDVPEATATLVLGLNNTSALVGLFDDANGLTHAFVCHEGACTPHDFPDAAFTQAVGINDAGDVVGGYGDAKGGQHGYLLSASRFRAIDAPADGFPPGSPIFTTAHDINNTGQIVGFAEVEADEGEEIFGWLLEGEKFTRIDVPGATGTIPLGINDIGQIVGNYQDEVDRSHGFLRQGETFITIDFPGAPNTLLSCINTHGQIVGLTIGQSRAEQHGFLATPIPQSTAAQLRADTAAAAGLSEVSKGLLLVILDGVLLQLELGEVFLGSATPASKALAQAKFHGAHRKLQWYEAVLLELQHNEDVPPGTASPLLSAANALGIRLQNVSAALCRECLPIVGSTVP